MQGTTGSQENNQIVSKTLDRMRLSGVAAPHQAAFQMCPACGTRARRVAARFCRTCGRRFAADIGYLPCDSLRASYHLQQHATHATNMTPHHRTTCTPPETGKPFVPTRNSVAALALASVAYALIPFLGILFCPVAISFGAWGAARAARVAQVDGWRAAVFSIVCGILLLVAQLLLWWMLHRMAHRAGT